jgi:hypothetical protein
MLNVLVILGGIRKRVTWREAPTPNSPRALLPCGCAQRIGIYECSTPRPEEWCLIEWPAGEAELAIHLAYQHQPKTLANTAKLRWRIERDYQDLKQKLGLGYYEGKVGAAFIITPRYASPPTDSRSPRGKRFPLSTTQHPSLQRTFLTAAPQSSSLAPVSVRMI